MKMHHTVMVALFAAVAFAAAADKDIMLTGCLIKGDGGYLIANLPSEPATTSSAASGGATTAIGTAGGYTPVFYWLDDDGDLKKHVGHRVEIEGHVQGDLKEGEIKLERKTNWTELQVKSDGRSMKAEVPNTSIVASPNDKDRKMTAIVRRVDVDHVRMLGARCE